MRADLWDSNEEFDGFLADLRESRQPPLRSTFSDTGFVSLIMPDHATWPRKPL